MASPPCPRLAQDIASEFLDVHGSMIRFIHILALHHPNQQQLQTRFIVVQQFIWQYGKTICIPFLVSLYECLDLYFR